MKRLLIAISVIIVLLFPFSALSGDVNWWDNTPEGRQLLKEDIQGLGEKIDRRRQEQREEERHQERMKKLQEIESEMYRMRLEQEWMDSQMNYERAKNW